jgi:GST-like protein
MKATVIHEFGDFDVLKYEDIETPKPKPSYALIKVLAAGVNRLDHYIREGSIVPELPFPHILGADAAGDPNGKIPAIVDQDAGGRTLMESGAILLYLADKTGRLISKDEDQRWRTIEWLMWQMGGIGPFLGQHLHFTHYKPDASDYGKERYANEARRLYGVLDQRLADREYLADDYSIADIATWPWIARHNWQRIDLNEYPHVRRWYVAIAERPAVQRGWRVPENDQEIPMPVMNDA